MGRLEPDFVPAARALGSGIHAAAAMLFRAVGRGERPSVEHVQRCFESFWRLETERRPLRYGERESKKGLLDLARRTLAVLCAEAGPGIESSPSSSRLRCRSSTRRPGRAWSAT